MLVSLHIRSMWETICDAQAGFCTVSSNSKFFSKFSRAPLWNFRPESPPSPKNFRFEMTKVYSREAPPQMKNFRFEMTKVYSREPPPNEKLQIWDDQSLLQRGPPKMKNFRFEMTKVYSREPPPMKNFRFEMTKVYSRERPPPMKNFRFEMTKVYSREPPPPGQVAGGSFRMWRLIFIIRIIFSLKWWYLHLWIVWFALDHSKYFRRAVNKVQSFNLPWTNTLHL